MQIIRKIIERKNIEAIDVPEEFGDEVEIIVLPLNTRQNNINRELECLMPLQDGSGFVSQLLADPNEDLWNDI